MIRKHTRLRGWDGALGFSVIMVMLLGMGCSLLPFASKAPRQVKLGISGGTQTLWLSLVEHAETASQSLGTDLVLTAFPTETELREAFLRGDVDIIATLPPAVPFLTQRGVQVKFIAPISWIREGYMFITPLDSAVTTMPQLVDKPVAVFPRSHPGFAYWQAFLLKNYGLRIDNLTAVESETPEKFLQRSEITAVATGSAQWAVLKGTGAYRKISDLNEEWRKISGSDRLLMFGGYAARSDFGDRNRDFVNAFIQLNYEFLLDYGAHKSAVMDAISSGKNNLGLSKEQNESIAWYLGLDDVDPKRVFIDEQDVRDYELIYKLLADAGFLDRAPSSVRDLFYVRE